MSERDNEAARRLDEAIRQHHSGERFVGTEEANRLLHDVHVAIAKSKSEARRLAHLVKQRHCDPNADTGWILPRPPRTGGN